MSETYAGGPYTRHGHPIPGITIVGTKRPAVARCGGPALCKQCLTDAAQLREEWSTR